MNIPKLYEQIIEQVVDQDQRELMPDRATRIERLRAYLILAQGTADNNEDKLIVDETVDD